MEKTNFALLFGHLAIYLFVWVFAVTTRAAAMAWTSNRFGDDTAKNQGRITLNPFVQADLLGTIIIPAAVFVLGWVAGGIPFVAWGKPVPVDENNWHKPRLAGAMVSLSEIFVNLSIALVSFLILKSLIFSGVVGQQEFIQLLLRTEEGANTSSLTPLTLILWYGLILNLALAVLSLIPFPPFNGGMIVKAIFPQSLKPIFEKIGNLGIIPVLLLIYFVIVPFVFVPMILGVIYLLGIALD